MTNIYLSGEDGLTLALLGEIAQKKTKLEPWLGKLGLEKIEKIFFRVSFGRGVRNGSGFGESDGILIGTTSNNTKKAIFIESKRKKEFDNEFVTPGLEYQFFLKIALVLSIKEKNQDRYEIGQENDIGQILNYLWEKKERNQRVRKVGWIFKSSSAESPIIKELRKIDSFGLLGIAFKQSNKQKVLNHTEVELTEKKFSEELYEELNHLSPKKKDQIFSLFDLEHLEDLQIACITIPSPKCIIINKIFFKPLD
jgi:hypothetical protein